MAAQGPEDDLDPRMMIYDQGDEISPVLTWLHQLHVVLNSQRGHVYAYLARAIATTRACIHRLEIGSAFPQVIDACRESLSSCDEGEELSLAKHRALSNVTALLRKLIGACLDQIKTPDDVNNEE